MATAIDPSSHAAEVKPGSNRNFGLVFAAAFAVIALLPLWGGHPVRWWALIVAALFLAAALLKPDVLAPLNYLWFRFGMLLSRVVSPVVMGAVFFLCVAPLGMLVRALGKDPLALRRDGKAASYWIVRDPPGPAPQSMKNQF